MLLTSVDFLEDREKRPYKPDRPALTIEPARSCDRAEEASFRYLPSRQAGALARSDGNRHYDVTRQFQCCRTLKVGSKTYAYYSLPTAEKNGLKGISRLPFSMKVLLENLLRNEDGRSVTKEDILAFAAVAQDQDLGPRGRVPPGARADAGLHRRAGGGRSRRHARRHEEARRRPEEDQSAGAGRSRHRPLGGGEFLRHQRRVQEERRGGIPAEPGTLRIPQMGAEVVRQFPRGAARHRHLPPGQSRIPVADGLDREGQAQGRRQADRRSRSPIRTRWSAPIRTPPWSTASPCSAGASAASRRKPPCSASPIRCCCRK